MSFFFVVHSISSAPPLNSATIASNHLFWNGCKQSGHQLDRHWPIICCILTNHMLYIDQSYALQWYRDQSHTLCDGLSFSPLARFWIMGTDFWGLTIVLTLGITSLAVARPTTVCLVHQRNKKHTKHICAHKRTTTHTHTHTRNRPRWYSARVESRSSTHFKSMESSGEVL